MAQGRAVRRNQVGCFAGKLWVGVAVWLLGITCAAQQSDLFQISLEDLMNIKVTTLGKRKQRLSQIPAAVYVITQDEIRRSGATNIPDALRLVPGIEVAQIDNTNWAISISGANSIGSNYTPLDSWRLSGSYSYLQQITHSTAPGRIVFSFPGQDGDNPRNQFQLHSYPTLPREVEADTSVYYVGTLAGQSIRGYTRLDSRLGWRPTHKLELSVGAQNVLDAAHYEFKPYWEYLASGKIERSFYGRLTWHF